jgi:peptidoglycan/xylan/chitin deacetylase (PgdA/CDA1 family)
VTKSQGREPTLTVLMFHGLVEEMPPYAVFPGSRTCLIRERDFEACIRWCTRNRKLLTLKELPLYLRREATDPGVLITFDDGLSSVIDLAVPLLLKHGATAVLFVTTGLIDSQEAPAVFRLERDLWEAPPKTLTVQMPGYDDFTAPVGARSAVRGALSKLWACCFARRIPPLSLAREWVRFDDRGWRPEPNAQDRHAWFPARWDDIANATRAGVLELGAHGVSHTPWSWLSAKDRRREIGEPRERLRQLAGTGVPACAYPHGLYDDAVRAEVRNSYTWAFTTRGHNVGQDPHDLLPRFHVPSERPVLMDLVVRWPFAGRLLRKGASLVGQA